MTRTPARVISGWVDRRVLRYVMDRRENYLANLALLTFLGPGLSRNTLSKESLRLAGLQPPPLTPLIFVTLAVRYLRYRSRRMNRIAAIGRGRPRSSSGSTKNRLWRFILRALPDWRLLAALIFLLLLLCLVFPMS